MMMILTITGCSKDQHEANPDSEAVSSVDTEEKGDKNLSNEFSFMNGKVSIPFKLKDLKNVTIDEEICYETDDLDAIAKVLRQEKFVRVSKAVPACAMDNNRVMFLFRKDVGLIELIEIKRV